MVQEGMRMKMMVNALNDGKHVKTRNSSWEQREAVSDADAAKAKPKSRKQTKTAATAAAAAKAKSTANSARASA